MTFSPEEPFRIEVVDEERVVVRFAPKCDQRRSKQHDEELGDLLERYHAVACDLSQTLVIGSDWLRWLARLSARAQRMGKSFAVAGLSEILRETADVLGLADTLHLIQNVEEIWSR